MAELLAAMAVSAVTNVNVPTATEVIAVSSGLIKIPVPRCRTCVCGWLQMTTVAGTTQLTPVILRGTDMVNDVRVNNEAQTAVMAAAGSTEPRILLVSELLDGLESVQYSLTVLPAGATAAGTILQACISVEILSG